MKRLIKLEKLLIFKINSKEQKPLVSEGIKENFIFRELFLDDILNYEVFKQKNRLIKYQNYLKSGHKIFGHFTKNGELAGYIWLGFIPENKDFPSRSGYVWDCRTLEKFRSLGIYRSALIECRSKGVDLGLNQLIIACHDYNIASKKAIEAAGFKLYSASKIIKFPKFQIISKGFFSNKFSLNKKLYFLY